MHKETIFILRIFGVGFLLLLCCFGCIIRQSYKEAKRVRDIKRCGYRTQKDYKYL